MEVQEQQQKMTKGSALLGFTGLRSKRTRSPSHALGDAEVTKMRPPTPDPCRVLVDTETDVDVATDIASELPWRTPSPSFRMSQPLSQQHEGWGPISPSTKCEAGVKFWNSAESEPMLLDFMDANIDIASKKTPADFLQTDEQPSANTSQAHTEQEQEEEERTENSEASFLFHCAPEPGDLVARAGWKKAQTQELLCQMPIGVDKDARDFLQSSIPLNKGKERVSRSTAVKHLTTLNLPRVNAAEKQASGCAKEAAEPPLAEWNRSNRSRSNRSRSNSQADVRSKSQGGDATSESDALRYDSSAPDMAKRSLMLRGIPQETTSALIRAAVAEYGEVERLVVYRAVSCAHVLFKNEEACSKVLRSKRVLIGCDPVDAICGPNCMPGVSVKRMSALTGKPNPHEEETGYISARIVGKADELTFGTGIRRAKFWVQRDYVGLDAANSSNSCNSTGKDENTAAVYNLPPRVNATTIASWFRRCGAIRRISIHDVVAGGSHYALVEFLDRAGVVAAVGEIDGLRKGGHVLKVKARGIVQDDYEMMKVQAGNRAAELGMSNSQPGGKGKR